MLPIACVTYCVVSGNTIYNLLVLCNSCGCRCKPKHMPPTVAWWMVGYNIWTRSRRLNPHTKTITILSSSWSIIQWVGTAKSATIQGGQNKVSCSYCMWEIYMLVQFWFQKFQTVPISNLTREDIYYFFTKKIITNEFQRKKWNNLELLEPNRNPNTYNCMWEDSNGILDWKKIYSNTSWQKTL